MSEESQTRRDNALDFLDELDGRHDLLLAELEQLNSRIDSVLSEYTKSRQSASLASGTTTQPPNEANSQNDASNAQYEAVDFD